MKKEILVAFFTGIVIFFYSCCNFAQNNLSEDQQIRDMLKEFYKIYITQIDKGPINRKKENSIKKKYCTTRLLEAIKNDKELDYDPLIDAQDADIESLKTLSIKKNIGIASGYIVTYESSSKYDNYEKTSIKLTVVKEKDGYKIDSVQSKCGKKY